MLSFSIGGLILEKTLSDPNLAGIIVFAPVINGKLFISFDLLFFVKYIFNARVF